MSFFEFQYGDRRPPRLAYAWCSTALKEFYTVQARRLAQKGYTVVQEAVRRMSPEDKKKYEYLKISGEHIIATRLEIFNQNFDTADCSNYSTPISANLAADLVAFDHERSKCSGPLRECFTWLIGRRMDLAYLFKYIRILQIVMNMKFNKRNGVSLIQQHANLKETVSTELIGLVGENFFFKLMARLLGQ